MAFRHCLRYISCTEEAGGLEVSRGGDSCMSTEAAMG